MVLIIIGVGGALGSVTRYKLGRFIGNKSTTTIPIGTLIINITGAFLLGILSNLNMDKNIYMFLTEGFLGAYTTFSTFMYEGFNLIQEKEKLNMFIYIVGTLILGIICFALGYFIIKFI